MWVLRSGCFLAWLVVLLRPGDIPDPIAVGPPWSLTCLCLALAGVVWLPDVIGRKWTQTPLNWILLLYLLVVGVISFMTYDENTTTAAVLQLAGNVGVFYSTVVVARRYPRLTGGILVLLVAAIALLLLMATNYHIEQGLGTRPEVYPVPEGWSGYPELSLLALVQLGILLAVLLTGRGRLMFVATSSLIVINLVELGLLYSRSAWPIAGLMVVAAAASIARRAHMKRLIVTVALLTLTGAIVVLATPTLRYLARTTFSSAAVGADQPGFVINVATVDMRLQIWRRTLRMIRDHAAYGVGPGNFREVFESRYNPEVNPDSRRGVHAHNLWLHHYAELGVPGGTLYLALWLTVGWIAWRSTRQQLTHRSLGILLAIVAILGSNLITNMFFLTGGASGRLQSLTWMLFGLAVVEAQRTAVSSLPAGKD